MGDEETQLWEAVIDCVLGALLELEGDCTLGAHDMTPFLASGARAADRVVAEYRKATGAFTGVHLGLLGPWQATVETVLCAQLAHCETPDRAMAALHDTVVAATRTANNLMRVHWPTRGPLGGGK